MAGGTVKKGREYGEVSEIFPVSFHYGQCMYGSGGFESDGKEYDLFFGGGRCYFQSIERTIKHTHVGSPAF